jgi:hypothetical protein
MTVHLSPRARREMLILAVSSMARHAMTTASNHVLQNHPSRQPDDEAGDGAQKPASDSMTPPYERTRNSP